MEQVNRRRGVPAEAFSRRFFGRGNEFEVLYSPSSSGTYNIFLDGEIEEASQFREAVAALDDAGENDTVRIHLSTNGGCVDTTDTFIAAMRRCRGRVVVEATGGVHSAGTIILLNAPEFRLSENFNALIHNGSFGVYGKTSDAKAQFAFQSQYMDRLAKTTYRGFLTTEEIDQLIAGKDFWLDSSEWIARYRKRQELLKAEAIARGDYDPERDDYENVLDEEE